MPRIGIAKRRPDAEGQTTIFQWIETLPGRAEVENAARPAVRLFCVVLALMAVGLLVQASHAATTESPAGFRAAMLEHSLFRVAALAVLLGAWRIGPQGLRPYLPALVALCVMLLLCVFLPAIGDQRNGSHRWVRMLGVSFQPSELARIVTVLWVADRCVKLGPLVSDMRRGVVPMLGLIGLVFMLVLVETDVGGSMLLLICAFSTMWVGGAHLKSLAVTLGTIGGGAITAAALLIPYVRNRLQLWLGHSHNLQVDSTLQAMATGGVFGTGLGLGRARNRGVPYLESDYVFAQVGEELGLFGLLLVLGLLLAFLWFSLRLVLSLRGRYRALSAFGLLVSVGLQAMLHVQVVAGLAPPKGMTLPFVSDGGTSLIVSSLAVGLALGAAPRGKPTPSESS